MRLPRRYYASTMTAARRTKTKSIRLDPSLVAEAQRATGAKSEAEAVRIALAELLERARFRKWVRRVASKTAFRGCEA